MKTWKYNIKIFVYCLWISVNLDSYDNVNLVVSSYLFIQKLYAFWYSHAIGSCDNK